jgi:CheY-like chemotaxis protein
MKILVIDDKQENLDLAKQQLKDHEVTMVSSYDEALKLVCNYDSYWGKLVKPDFDAVLTDLLMPAGRSKQGDKGMRFVGQEMPLGIFLAIQAANVGVQFVGLLTDKNHHDHPASAALDQLCRMKINDSALVIENNCGPTKRWDKLLDRLLNPPQPPPL